MGIKKRLEKLMEDRGLNASKLADIAGLPKSTVYTLLKRDSSNVSYQTVLKLATALECNALDILDFEEDDKMHDHSTECNDFINSYEKHASHNSPRKMNLQLFATSDGLLHDGESKILKSYDKLNTGGKLEAIKRVEELTLIEKYTRKDDDGNNE